MNFKLKMVDEPMVPLWKTCLALSSEAEDTQILGARDFTSVFCLSYRNASPCAPGFICQNVCVEFPELP